MSSKVDLKLDWCSHEAAKFACEHWHYSKCIPSSKLVKIGVWENSKYIGCVIFGSGANSGLGTPYGLTQFETCELVRIALTIHDAPVSRISSIAIKMLKKAFPKLRLIVSFADPEHGHVGGIYQAMNWIYCGETIPADEFIVNGKRWHGRGLRSSLEGMGLTNGTTLERARKLDLNAKKIKGSSKYRYIMPLDNEMRRRVEPLRKPYPKKPCAGSETVTRRPIQDGEGGSIPTPALIGATV